MGKVRIKQVSEGFEDLQKPKRKKAAVPADRQVVAQLAVPKSKKDKARAPGQKAGERMTTVAPSAAELKAAEKPEKHAAAEDAVKGLALEKTATKPSRRPHPRLLHGRSARYKKLARTIQNEAPLMDAIKLARKTATAKFPETIELHLTVNKNGLRTQVTLPHPLTKKRTIIILTSSPTKLTLPTKLNSVVAQLAGPEKIAEIKSANSPPTVDELWATPDVMSQLAPIAPILGPAGLMPNPKRGTVVKPDDLPAKLDSLSTGQTELAAERKAPVIHTTLGKANDKPANLTANLEAIITAVRPENIRRATLSSTMGPGIKIIL